MSLFSRWFKSRTASRTYSQSGEDSIISYLLTSVLGRRSITYIDAGANDPRHGNNTYLFYREGHRGVCIEPNPYYLHRLRRARPRDMCVAAGIATAPATHARFYVMSPPTLSTFSQQLCDAFCESGRYQLDHVIEVPLVTLNDTIDRYCPRCPELLSIDVEGLDSEIIRSFDFSRHRPAVICVETVSHLEEEKDLDVLAYMSSQDYAVYADTFINTIFVEGTAWRSRRR